MGLAAFGMGANAAIQLVSSDGTSMRNIVDSLEAGAALMHIDGRK